MLFPAYAWRHHKDALQLLQVWYWYMQASRCKIFWYFLSHPSCRCWATQSRMRVAKADLIAQLQVRCLTDPEINYFVSRRLKFPHLHPDLQANLGRQFSRFSLTQTSMQVKCRAVNWKQSEAAGSQQAFVLDSNRLLEINWFKSEYSSWFVDETVISGSWSSRAASIPNRRNDVFLSRSYFIYSCLEACIVSWQQTDIRCLWLSNILRTYFHTWCRWRSVPFHCCRSLATCFAILGSCKK